MSRGVDDRRVRLVMKVLEELQAFEAEDRGHTGHRKGDTCEGMVDAFVGTKLFKYTIDDWSDEGVQEIVLAILKHAPNAVLSEMVEAARAERKSLASERMECERIHWPEAAKSRKSEAA